MGRPLEFSRAEALDTAMRLFWDLGYHGASLRDLLKARGLSKSSFYQSFESKEALFRRCVSRYRDAVLRHPEGDTRRPAGEGDE